MILEKIEELTKEQGISITSLEKNFLLGMEQSVIGVNALHQ